MERKPPTIYPFGMTITHGILSCFRARHPTSRELSTIRLAQYINALLVVYLNPRDFHGHDLVTLLEGHVINSWRNSRQGPFAKSLSIIALYNARVPVDVGYVLDLMNMQRADGSIGYSIGKLQACIFYKKLGSRNE